MMQIQVIHLKAYGIMRWIQAPIPDLLEFCLHEMQLVTSQVLVALSRVHQLVKAGLENRFTAFYVKQLWICCAIPLQM